MTSKEIEDIKYEMMAGCLKMIRWFCRAHPTCDGCPFRKEHIGCSFRGKSPREWES